MCLYSAEALLLDVRSQLQEIERHIDFDDFDTVSQAEAFRTKRDRLTQAITIISSTIASKSSFPNSED